MGPQPGVGGPEKATSPDLIAISRRSRSRRRIEDQGFERFVFLFWGGLLETYGGFLEVERGGGAGLILLLFLLPPPSPLLEGVGAPSTDPRCLKWGGREEPEVEAFRAFRASGGL